jgi:hypothetical protein
VPILASHHGRAQHGYGDQSSRQNFEFGHFSFSIGTEAKTFWRLLFKMSGVTGGLNEIFVYGRSPLREVGGGNHHKFRPAFVMPRCA